MKKHFYLIIALCLVLLIPAGLYLYFNHKKSAQTPATPNTEPSLPAVGNTPVSGVSAPANPPSTETTKFITDLQDPKVAESEKSRILAVLGKQKQVDAFPALSAAAFTGPEKLQFEAILAMAQYEDPDLRLQMLNLLHDRCNDARLKSGIQVLKEADRHVDLSEMKALAAHSSDIFILKLLALYAYDENPDVRLSVIEWLERYDNTTAKLILVYLLEDEEFRKSDSLRLALFFALKKWKEDKEVVQCITEHFDKEHYPEWF